MSKITKLDKEEQNIILKALLDYYDTDEVEKNGHLKIKVLSIIRKFEKNLIN